MQTTAETRIISIASGKGGVGKTAIAANLAYTLGRRAKSILLDLDLQNQGCTGLFRQHSVRSDGNMYDIIRGASVVDADVVQVAEGLSFIPAVSWRAPPSQRDMYDVITSQQTPQHLLGFLSTLASKSHYTYIIVDCHGGMDLLSLASFYYASDALVITEPDPVTFNGTLELLRTYDEAREQLGAEVGEQAAERVENVAAGRSCRTHLVVNRLSGKLSYRSLEALYRPYFGIGTDDRTQEISSIQYIPSEELLAESFGDHPFYVQLVPRSVYGHKIRNLAEIVTGRASEHPGWRSLVANALSRSIGGNTARITRSREYVARARLMSWALAGLLFLFLVGMTVSFDFGGPNEPVAVVSAFYLTALALYAMLALKSMFGVYRDRWRYEIGLATRQGQGIVGVRNMRIALLSIIVCVIAIGIVVAGYITLVLGILSAGLVDALRPISM